MKSKPVSADSSVESTSIEVDGEQTTVFIADSSPLMATLLQLRLSRFDSVRVVGHALRQKDVLARIAQLRPRVVLLSQDFQDLNYFDTAAAIKKEAPGCRVIALIDRDGDINIHRNVAAGTDGYILRDPSNRMLEPAITAICRGETWFDPALQRMMLDCSPESVTKGHAADPASPPAPALSEEALMDTAEREALHAAFLARRRRFPVKEVVRIGLIAIGAAALMIPAFHLLYRIGLEAPPEPGAGTNVAVPSNGRMFRLVEIR